VPCLLEALMLEVGVADGQRLVDDQDVGPARGGDAERQAHLHARRVHAHRLVDVVADVGERFDLRHQRDDFIDPQADQLAGHQRVLAAGEIGVETHAQFQQRRHAALDRHASRGRLRGAGNELEQRALAGAVDADDAHRFARRELEADVLQHPFLAVALAQERQRPFGQPVPALVVDLVGLAQLLDAYASHWLPVTVRRPSRPSACGTTAGRARRTPVPAPSPAPGFASAAIDRAPECSGRPRPPRPSD
jgi:hypothetical protein